MRKGVSGIVGAALILFLVLVSVFTMYWFYSRGVESVSRAVSEARAEVLGSAESLEVYYNASDGYVWVRPLVGSPRIVAWACILKTGGHPKTKMHKTNIILKNKQHLTKYDPQCKDYIVITNNGQIYHLKPTNNANQNKQIKQLQQQLQLLKTQINTLNQTINTVNRTVSQNQAVHWIYVIKWVTHYDVYKGDSLVRYVQSRVHVVDDVSFEVGNSPDSNNVGDHYGYHFVVELPLVGEVLEKPRYFVVALNDLNVFRLGERYVYTVGVELDVVALRDWISNDHKLVRSSLFMLETVRPLASMSLGNFIWKSHARTHAVVFLVDPNSRSVRNLIASANRVYSGAKLLVLKIGVWCNGNVLGWATTGEGRLSIYTLNPFGNLSVPSSWVNKYVVLRVSNPPFGLSWHWVVIGEKCYELSDDPRWVFFIPKRAGNYTLFLSLEDLPRSSIKVSADMIKDLTGIQINVSSDFGKPSLYLAGSRIEGDVDAWKGEVVLAHYTYSVVFPHLVFDSVKLTPNFLKLLRVKVQSRQGSMSVNFSVHFSTYPSQDWCCENGSCYLFSLEVGWRPVNGGTHWDDFEVKLTEHLVRPENFDVLLRMWPDNFHYRVKRMGELYVYKYGNLLELGYRASGNSTCCRKAGFSGYVQVFLVDEFRWNRISENGITVGMLGSEPVYYALTVQSSVPYLYRVW